ncbi:MAG TPA: AAA family ATPase [Candidatus Limnocylindria bacterium]
MRIEKIVARAFGPFRGEELRLAPGMTVVSGPNEAGKSTWHAALRLALTGLRRGKGPGTAAERQLAERHRPWDVQDAWAVEARLRLADGRLIDITQDLAGKVDCRAVDVGLGRDVSHEILDGTPDASRWLGLNREAFAATISVSQAQILAVTEAADELQEQMQRAAATQGTDATAAEAIARLEAFRRDAVGVDRVGARGPLRAAKDRLAALEARLAEARRQHDEYLARSAEVDGFERRVDHARRQLREAEAQLAALRAATARRRHRQAAELAARHPAPPDALAARDERADEVAGAIDAWTSRPQPLALEGSTAAELEAELAGLPDALEPGDLEPHGSVREALRALELAEDALTQLGDEPDAHETPLPDVEEGRMRDLARRLRDPQLPNATRLERELDDARSAAAAARSPLGAPFLAGGAAALLGGLVLVAAGAALAAVLFLLVVGIAAGAAGWFTGAAARAAAARVARAEAALAPYREAYHAADADRTAAAAEAGALGLPTDPAALDDLADRIASAAAARRAGLDREARRRQLAERREVARGRLADAIVARGGEPADEARAAWAAYESACASRAARAAAVARRAALERELQARRAAELSAEAARAAAEAAERRLRSVATALGVGAEEAPDVLVHRLRAWQGQRGEDLRRNEAAIGEWQRLQSLLDGASLSELDERASGLEAAAATLAAELGGSVSPPDEPPAEIETRVARRSEELRAATSAHDALRGNLEARRDALPDVAEAEESVLAARAELARVLALAETLDRTLSILRGAEERVHRSLAPVLASAIGRWLPAVCQGAYVDVSVDPADLAVRVKEAATGKWREARLLSEGTREQIYLLLRVAMAEHLVTNGEIAPLLLDEVTVQSDPLRKHELLDVLHRLSAERQVVLFTHDDDVLAWAGRRLDGERDATVLLPARPPAGAVPAAGVAADTVALPVEDQTPAPLPD